MSIQEPSEPLAPHWIGAGLMRELLPTAQAIDALEATLRDGYDPEEDGERTQLSAPNGDLLQMPSATAQWCGTKLVTIRSGKEVASLPAIQGVYVLFEGATLRPVAILDGAALTTLRTPAVTALAVRHIAPPGASRVALFGTGVQAHAHVKALQAVMDVEHIDVIGRSAQKTAAVVATATACGLSAEEAEPDVVATADLIVCCTASPEPLFDGNLVSNHAAVAAIGSHDPSSREVDTALVQRSTCIIESRSSAEREAGDLIIPASQGDLKWEDAVTLRDVICGTADVTPNRPRLFKGTGMPWQDLAVVARIVELHP